MKQKRKDYLARLAEVQKQSNELVAQHIADHRAIVQSQKDPDDDATFGQRAADAVARFGGSWTFIMVFAAVLVAWVALNSYVLVKDGHKPFDPFPYILLNLFLSMLASIQAPVILMSQNRQGEKDRLSARNDYEVNLKAELEIISLHEKIDAMKAIQLEQTHLLAKLCATRDVVYKEDADSQ
jgi:uncharacterized membrane protein